MGLTRHCGFPQPFINGKIRFIYTLYWQEPQGFNQYIIFSGWCVVTSFFHDLLRLYNFSLLKHNTILLKSCWKLQCWDERGGGILLENCKGIRDDRVRYLFRSSHILLRKATILHVIQQHPFQRVDVMLEEKVLLLFHTWHHFPQKVHVPLFLTLC